ncbi:MAG TPA: AAA family ATPase [Streptosporangiaceae bacterium]|nr:AAA family ATPase [Streptosporangiaceae bacterium]
MTCPQCGMPSEAPHRFCPSCGTPLSRDTEHREARKTVSILFIDLVDSTVLGERLDPEPLRQITDRYFAACAAAISEHGGAVEKYIGDAVMAAFGAHVAHEDDALRTVRAAAGALAALAVLSAELEVTRQVTLQARCGIASGEVMVITAPGGDFRVVGDAVNTAARLQAAAPPGGILVGADTASMIRGWAGLVAVPPLRLKGKAEAVPAWQVTDPELAQDGSPVRAAPLIGRDDDLAELQQSFRRVTRRHQVCLVTVLGAPGIGKSRLVQEFLAPLGADRREAVTVLSGRCSAYGRGITYQPLADMLGSYPGGWDALAAAFPADAGPGRRAAESLAVIRGLAPAASPAAAPGPAAPGGAEAVSAAGTGDIAWAVRHVLEAAGRDQPVIMVWEDLHWAEATLLDLIDDIATWLADVPVLLLCAARPELLEARPTWGGGKPCAMTVELGPLTHEQSATLVSELAMHDEVYAQDDHEAYRQVARQCDGNPLFAELMLDVVAQAAPGAQVPLTIQALLGARLDQLPDDERRLLEMAAVIGRDVGQDLLLAIAGTPEAGDAPADQLIAALVRRRLLRRAGPDRLQFTQALLRDTAYAYTPKARRERWHAVLAARLTPPPGATADVALDFAYHAEAACLLHRELEPGDRGRAELASAAADALIAAGMHALDRKDLPAAAVLLERGRDLLPAADARHPALALHICDSWLGLWDERRALAALAAAESARPRAGAGAITAQRAIVELRRGLTPPAAVAAAAERAGAVLAENPGDDLGWCRWHQLRAYLYLADERAGAADDAFRQALARARALADRYEEERLLCAICELAQWAPTSVRAGLLLCETLAARFAANRALLVPVLVTQAHLLALAGELSAARAALATARSCAGDLHLDLADAAVMEISGLVESLAGAHDRAEAHFRREAAVLHEKGQVTDARLAEVGVARELFCQGRTSAALDALRPSAGGAGDQPGDGDGDGDGSLRLRISVTALRGRIALASGQPDRAVALARQAATLAAGTDDLCLSGEALFDLAIVLRATGRAAEATAAGNTAAQRFDAKGAALLTREVRDWLAAGDPGQSGRGEGGTDGG